MLTVVLWCFAAALGYRAWTLFHASRDGHRRWSRDLGAAPTGIGEIVEMAAAAVAELGAGTFRQAVSLTGTAEGDTRPAPRSGVPSLWSRALSERRVRGDRGSTRTEVVSDRQVHGTLRLRDSGATVTVDLAEAAVDVPVAERAAEGPGPDERIELGPVSIVGLTPGHEHTEWRIEPGTRVTVIGEARDSGDGVRIAAGPDRPLTVTTADRGDHLDGERLSSRTAMRQAYGWAATAAVAAVLALVVTAMP